MVQVKLASPSETCSLRLGGRIGEQVEGGDVFALWGDLGSGKTLFTRGIARGMGVPLQIPVTSPTFTLINEYEGRLHLFHLDLYRLTTSEELETLPWREALFGAGVTVIEWPERLGAMLPETRWDINFEFLGDDCRIITFSACGDHHRVRLAGLAPDLIEIASSAKAAS
jgi:tRNA threonylcarbamoyladenosine biosynthesis protein TsaE